MTVSTAASRKSFAGNGSTTAFAWPYEYRASADLKVVLVSSLNVATLKTLTTHYTVSGVSDSHGGYSSATVTMTTAPASGETLIIYRSPALTQETDVESENDPEYAINNALDRVTYILQHMENDKLGLPIGVSESFAAALPDLPDDDGISYALGPNADRTALSWLTTFSGATVSSGLTGFVTASSLLSAAALLGEAESGYARTSWYGTNDAALASAKATAGAGGIVIIDNAMTITSTATLAGYIARFEGGTMAPPASSATLTFDHIEASPVVQIFTGANIARVRFAKQTKVYAPWFGQVADGSTDDSDQINAAIGALPVSGGDVYILGPTTAIDTALAIGDGTSTSRSTRVGIRLIGMAAGGGATAGEWGAPTDGVRLIWTGATSATACMLDIKGPIHSCQFRDLMFDCAGLAGIGVKGRMLFNCRFDNVRVTKYTTLAWDLQVHDATLPTGVAVGFATNVYTQCGAFTPWASGALATGASALRMYGGHANNIAMSRNVFIGGDWHYGGAAGTFGLELRYADNNTFMGMHFTNVGGSASGDDIRFVKNTTGSNVGLFPLENIFVQCMCLKNIRVYDDGGSSINTSSAQIGYNYILGLSIADGVTVPVNDRVVAIQHSGLSTGGYKSISPSAGLGYATGAGGAITQGTSRTTGVTLDKVTGAITLFSAAGSATPASFTVTNAQVAATDTIILSQKSGTDKYILLVTAVAAGSFVITFYTTGGTTTEQPVFNFSVIKAVAA